MVGNFFGGEQPAWGFMRALGPWVWLACQPGVQQVVFDWCRYHREFKKTTRLLTNFPGMDQLGKRCHHAQRHVPLKGQATTRAGAYSRAFCEKVATLCWNGWSFKDDRSELVGDLQGNHGRRVPKFSSPLWAVQLSESLCWKTFMQYQFKQTEHINLQETKARRTLIKRLKKNQRVAVF